MRVGASSMASDTFDPHARLQSKAGFCAYLGGICDATYDAGLARGGVPGPVRGTTRYDVRQHDQLLDMRSGIAAAVPIATVRRLSPLEEYEAARCASG